MTVGGKDVAFFVDSRLVTRRRRKRRMHVPVDLLMFGIAFSLGLSAVFFPTQLGISNPLGLFFASLALFAIGAYALRMDLRFLREINPVSIAELGLYPPFKPRQRLSKEDWFVPYKDIVSMVPVAEKGGFVPAYDVTLRDGLTFQLNALDLLVYVDEKEVRRYGKLLAVIKEEIEKPENRARAGRGEEVVIPRERFESVLKAWTPAPGAPARSMFWYFLLIGLVAGFVAALIIGFAILR
jgi:hypothetical protein